MLRNVAVVVLNGFLPFEFGTICEVFGIDRSDDGLPSYDFGVVAGETPLLGLAVARHLFRGGVEVVIATGPGCVAGAA